AASFEQLTDDRFAGSAAVVDRRVDDVAARGLIRVEHPPALVGWRAPAALFPECHRPEEQLRPPQTGPDEQPVGHAPGVGHVVPARPPTLDVNEPGAVKRTEASPNDTDSS